VLILVADFAADFVVRQLPNEINRKAAASFVCQPFAKMFALGLNAKFADIWLTGERMPENAECSDALSMAASAVFQGRRRVFQRGGVHCELFIF